MVLLKPACDRPAGADDCGVPMPSGYDRSLAAFPALSKVLKSTLGHDQLNVADEPA